ncbi:hypothetical protein PGB90_002753 [Kerria lacca]
MPEIRGGKRQTDIDVALTESIVKHIKSFKRRDSHYGRRKSVRLYLSPELNVKRMWELWKELAPDENKASYDKYYHIFTTQFNIGFNPQSDICSVCEEKKAQIHCNINKEENKT